jgi:uncharacterized protein YeeX (DUF496 family)
MKMEKIEAIKNTIERVKDRNTREFENKVTSLIYKIGNLSNELREAKQELKDLTFTEPEIENDLKEFIS